MKLPARSTPKARRRVLDQARRENAAYRARTAAGDPLAGLGLADKRLILNLGAAPKDLVWVVHLLADTLARLDDMAGGVERAGAVDPAHESGSNPTGHEDAPRPAVDVDDPEALTPPPQYGDPVGEQLLTPDAAQREAERIRNRARTIASGVERLLEELVMLAPAGQPRPISEADRRRAHAENERTSCEHCAKVEVTPGVPWECTADIRTSTVGDRLKVAATLCRACRWQVEQSANAGSRRGRLPATKTVAQHMARAVAAASA